jgi:hypothetical protein
VRSPQAVTFGVVALSRLRVGELAVAVSSKKGTSPLR